MVLPVHYISGHWWFCIFAGRLFVWLPVVDQKFPSWVPFVLYRTGGDAKERCDGAKVSETNDLGLVLNRFRNGYRVPVCCRYGVGVLLLL